MSRIPKTAGVSQRPGMVHFRAFGARLFLKQNVGWHVIALENAMDQAAKPGANGLAFFGPYGENLTFRTGLGDIEIQVPIKE